MVGGRPPLRGVRKMRRAPCCSPSAFAETTRLLDSALTQEADNATARGALAALWKSRLVEAEQRGEEADTAHALAMLRRYDDGALAAFVKGDGTLFGRYLGCCLALRSMLKPILR